MNVADLVNVVPASLADIAFATIAGAALADAWLYRDGGIAIPALRKAVRAGILALAVWHLVRPWALAAGMTGAEKFSEIWAYVPDVLSATRQGPLWYANSIFIALLAAVIFWRSDPAGDWQKRVLWMSLCGIAAVRAASGHAADQGDFTPDELAQFLHLLCTAIWAGGVMVSGLIAVPAILRESPEAVSAYGNRLSRIVTFAIVGLVISGAWTANTQLTSSLHALASTDWGQILIAKLLLVAIALGLGARNRLLLQRGAWPASATGFRRLLQAEAVVMVLILGLSALLSDTTPPTAGH